MKKSLELAMSIKRAQMKKPSLKDLPEMEESPKSVADAIMQSRKKADMAPDLEPTFEEQADEVDPFAYEPGFDDVESSNNEKPESEEELDRMSRVDKIRAMMKARRS